RQGAHRYARAQRGYAVDGVRRYVDQIAGLDLTLLAPNLHQRPAGENVQKFVGVVLVRLEMDAGSDLELRDVFEIRALGRAANGFFRKHEEGPARSAVLDRWLDFCVSHVTPAPPICDLDRRDDEAAV